MKAGKEIKAIPWPEHYAGIAQCDFSVSGVYKAVDHERVLLLTFMLNREHLKAEHNWSYQPTDRDFRIVISKKQRDFLFMRRNENGTARKDLCEAAHSINFYACYPDIDERTEAMIANVTGHKTTQNHQIPELRAWMLGADAHQKELMKRAHGEIDDDLIDACPTDLPAGLWEFVEREIIRRDRTIIYKHGGVRGTCSLCGQKVRAPTNHHFRQGCSCECPECGEPVMAVLEDSALWKADFVDNVMMAQKGQDGTVWFRLWHVNRDNEAAYEGGGEKWLFEIARYCVRGDKAAQWNQVYKEQAIGRAYEYRLDRWTRIARVYTYDGQYTFCDLGLREAVAGSGLEFARIPEYLDDPAFRSSRNVLMYALNFARYPVMEFLYKGGYTQLVAQKVGYGTSKENRNAILWQRKTLKECFRFPLRLLKMKKPKDWTMDDLERVRQFWAVPGMTDKLLREMLTENIETAQVKTVFYNGKPEKTLNYLKRQAAEHKNESLRSIAGTYRDYMAEVEKLQLNKKDESVAFPKDLFAQHARTSAMVEYEQNKALYDKFEKRVKKLAALAWENGDYLIRPAGTPAELKLEGAALHHCVGGYSDSMASGNTAIFFIRKKADPESSFFTLEYRSGAVVQCRTLNNRGYETEPTIKAFVKEWTEQLAAKAKRPEKKKKTASAAA